MSAIARYNGMPTIHDQPQNRSIFSSALAKVARNVNVLALGVVAVVALSSLPTAEAGAGAYWSCIQTCVQGMGGPNWYATFICPTICAPFLLGPG